VMDVVIVLPPTETETAYPVGDKGAEYTVRGVVACDSGVSGVVRDDCGGLVSGVEE
jgi:hypothetical protein